MEEVAADKIQKLTTELEHPPFYDPAVERLREGFNYFKINKFEYVDILYIYIYRCIYVYFTVLDIYESV